jgi:hypothetical protein
MASVARSHRKAYGPIRRNDLWTIYDPTVRRHVSMTEAHELCTPGQTVLRLFWCPQAQRHVTVPGASLHTIQADGTYALVREVD